MQLRLLASAAAAVMLLLPVPEARAENTSQFSTSWFQQLRRGPLGGLTVIHPRGDVSVRVGERASVSAGYSSDIVSGATPAIYTVDVVSTATTFEDLRHEGSVGLTLEGNRSVLGVSAGASTERDYTSLVLTASGAVDLAGRNTNVALSYSRNFDQVCDRDNSGRTPLEREALIGEDPCEKGYFFGVDEPGQTVWRDIVLDTTEITLTQNLAPTMVMQLALYGQVIRGFQANPYRRVRVAGVDAQESVPSVRARTALVGRLNRYIPPTRGAVHLAARGYSDTWGINSASLEMAYSQYAGDNLIIRTRGRVYQQSEATFFKDAYFYDVEGPAGAFFTGNRELAPLRSILAGSKLSYIGQREDGSSILGFFDELRLDLKGDLLFFQELPADPIDQNPFGISGQFLSSDRILDGFILQLGLQFRF
jgi:hypothetical protein